MSYEIDLKIQNCLKAGVKIPEGYLKEMNPVKTIFPDKYCAEVESRVLGKVYSRSYRKKVFAKIEYFKRSSLIAGLINHRPGSLEQQVDFYFQKYMNKEIDVKTFGQKVQELKLKEIDNA